MSVSSCTTLLTHPFNLLSLLSQFGLSGLLALTPSLGGLRSSLGVHDIVPPSETAGVITDESFVVCIMMVSTRVEWEEVVQAPREFVTTVSINSLEET